MHSVASLLSLVGGTRLFTQAMMIPALYRIDECCPWCGEPLELTIDCSIGDQHYVEDCQICCAPILVTVVFSVSGSLTPDVFLSRENE
jgi:hypothetical protein